MTLAVGTQLGSYRITGLLGVGGMGEVYRARDTTLDREVAIKVLPESFAQDADRIARFEREAKTLASLNHNNIAQIYGIEKGDVTAIVMELVEGPTLADRIAEGPLPPDEALRIARQIIDGLEAAHDKGIVHRDLKPANIKVTADGLVKILDFGIAKSIAASGSSGGKSPTMITPAVTEAGIIMGTAAYMSPEQARGKFVDQRTDIWAFGCVLYEMLTGQPVFIGEDVMIVMASILRDQSDLASIPASISPAVRHAIKLCLEKDPKKRLHHIGDVRLALAGVLESGVLPAASMQRSSSLRFWLKTLPLAVIVAALAGTAVWQFKPEPARPVIRFMHDLPDGRALVLGAPGVVVIAPDGRRLVYNSSDGFVLRDFDAIEDRLMPGTENRYGTEFSPDGESLAFFRTNGAGVDLVRMAVSGGVEVELAYFPTPQGGGLSWETDGMVLVGRSGEGIYRVNANGGDPELIVELKPDQYTGTPQLLPDGEWILFPMLSQGTVQELLAQSLITGERKQLRPGAENGSYAPSGHLIYRIGTTLFAVAFNPKSAEMSGTPVPVVQNVRSRESSPYDFSAAGTLVYVPDTGLDVAALTLALADGQGNERQLPIPAGTYSAPRASADGRWIAYQAQYSDGTDIAVVEVGTTAAPRRLTFGGDNTNPVWSADSSRVAYASVRAGGPGLYWRFGDGSGVEERLTQAAAGATHVPDHFSPDGQHLAYSVSSGGASTIWLHALETGADSLLIESIGAGASHAMFAPDGRWLAYQAHDTGDNEVFVQPFPPTGAKYQLPHRNDNHHAIWSADGRQLYYIPGPERLERVDVVTERGVAFGNPVVLTLTPLRDNAPGAARQYDLMPDGALLGVMPQGADLPLERDRLIVVQNWFAELKRLVPSE